MACENNILDLSLNSSSPDPNDVVIFTDDSGVTTIRRWSTVLNSLAPADIEYKVGVTPGYPSDGDSTYTATGSINRRVRVYRDGKKQSTIDPGGGYYFSFVQATGVITFTPNQMADEVILIEIY